MNGTSFATIHVGPPGMLGIVEVWGGVREPQEGKYCGATSPAKVDLDPDGNATIPVPAGKKPYDLHAAVSDDSLEGVFIYENRCITLKTGT